MYVMLYACGRLTVIIMAYLLKLNMYLAYKPYMSHIYDIHIIFYPYVYPYIYI